MLKTIKLIHTIIWLVMVAAIFYILFAGITNTFNIWLGLSISLLVFETLVLLINGWTCPLTPMARKYTTEEKENFDIYLPNWIAKHNKIIFGALFILGLLLVSINLIKS